MNYYGESQQMAQTNYTFYVIVTLLIIAAVTIVWFVWLYPKWRVWASHQAGLADLQRAKNEQQIQIAEAKSRLDAAELNKQAAIIEAEAVSRQIETIGKRLTEHDLYLKWQWIEMMKETAGSGDTVIYVPTEASMPILEAARLSKRSNEAADEN